MAGWDGLNRRKFPRVKYPCLVTCRTQDDEPEVFLTHTENLGVGGVCLIAKRDFKIFAPVDVEIDLMNSSEHIKCKGRIVWCIQRRQEEKKKHLFYDTGIEFTDLPSEDRQRIDFVIKSVVRRGDQSLVE